MCDMLSLLVVRSGNYYLFETDSEEEEEDEDKKDEEPPKRSAFQVNIPQTSVLYRMRTHF